MLILALALVLGLVPIPGLCQQERLFYYVNNEGSFTSFKANIEHITVVAPQVYAMDADGIIWGTVDSRMMSLARAHGVRVMPLVMNPGFDRQLLHEALQNPVARQRAVKTMVALCQEYDFMGIQFDFENIHVDDREAFTQFFREAGKALHKKGYQISAAVMPRTSDFAGQRDYSQWIYKYWRGGYDLKTLGQIGDFISIMTYDQHTRLTTPGPVAGLPWLEENLKFVLTQIPARKISLGFPLYSRRWFADVSEDQATTHSQGLAHEKAVAIMKQYDTAPLWVEDQCVHMVMFENREGPFEFLFLEDARSFQDKLSLIEKYSLRGFSAWRLGHEDKGIWKLFESH